MRFRFPLLAILMVACLPAGLFAAEVATEAPAIPSTGNWILDMAAVIATVLGTIITGWLTKFLSSKSAEARQKLEDSTLTALERIRYETEAIIYDVVGNINQKHLPVLIRAVAEKKIDSIDDLKSKLKGLGDEALQEVLDIAAERGIDVVDKLGRKWVIAKIRAVVDEKSPFLGDTAESLLNGGADLLVNKGTEWLKGLGANTDEGKAIPAIVPAAAVPAPTAGPVNG